MAIEVVENLSNMTRGAVHAKLYAALHTSSPLWTVHVFALCAIDGGPSALHHVDSAAAYQQMRESMRKAVVGLVVLAALATLITANAQDAASVRVAAVKYEGGGDWYQAQSPLPNLLDYVREHTLLQLEPQPDVVELSSDKVFSYPFLFLSGHGNVVLSDDEARRLRRYLENGGFLYVDDDYGIDEYIRREMQKVFPAKEFVELPFDHEIYDIHFGFTGGLPKIHEHDNEAPRGYGLFHEDRLVVFYTYETNISDGWESPQVHNDPPEKREAALQMGTNILTYALTH